MSTGRWRGVPPRVRLVVSAAVLVFAYGGVVHVLHLLVPGLRPPLAVPGWLAVYFASLTLWDRWRRCCWRLAVRRDERPADQVVLVFGLEHEPGGGTGPRATAGTAAPHRAQRRVWRCAGRYGR
ncbi:hypothetical protein [Micromonospora sp. NPDC049102]|uniref:hypothetical protein n=1 Tax=Micromonospora sp. NPDC049102 TaxID=3364265 RepID=UPI00372047CF